MCERIAFVLLVMQIVVVVVVVVFVIVPRFKEFVMEKTVDQT
jgi:uncharacterized protein YpmS